MKNNNIILKKVITVLVLITILLALLFGAALYNHFFNLGENENQNQNQNGFNPINPPNNTIPRDPVLPPAIE